MNFTVLGIILMFVWLISSCICFERRHFNNILIDVLDAVLSGFFVLLAVGAVLLTLSVGSYLILGV